MNENTKEEGADLYSSRPASRASWRALKSSRTCEAAWRSAEGVEDAWTSLRDARSSEGTDMVKDGGLEGTNLFVCC